MRIVNGIVTDVDTMQSLDTDDLATVALNGTDVPASTPVYVGQFYVDTSGKKLYVATGTTNSSDWTILN